MFNRWGGGTDKGLRLRGQPKIDAHYGQVVTLPYSSLITINLAVSNRFRVTLAGNPTLAVINWPPYGGKDLILNLIQDSSGSRVVTWWTSPTILWAGGTAPSLTTTASKTDKIIFDIMPGGVFHGSWILNF